MSHPRRGILKNVSFELLHEDQIVEDNDGVVLTLSDQHALKCLTHPEKSKREQWVVFCLLTSL